jgi:hypothetical protein
MWPSRRGQARTRRGQPQLWFRHDAEGRPTAHAVEETKQPEFPSGPLRETEVTLADFGPRWRWQSWGKAGNLHRLGGPPAWVQSADYPACPSCERRCAFLLQLDSELPLEGGGEWLWGSGGVAYVFWCDACRVSGQLWQCT